jgi:DNA-binding transcriptional LysR family regulator
MNLPALDLNLLVALEALLAETHVGRAARRIGLSQPATSHALQRLRHVLNDPILVRVGVRMQPTPRAIALRAPLADALEQIRGLFVAKAFDPATSDRRFTLVMPDHVADLVVPPLTKRALREAPGVRFDIVPWTGPAMMTGESASSIDLAIVCLKQTLTGFHKAKLFEDTEAIAVRKGHPVGLGLKRLDAFLAARHVAVIGQYQREDLVDTWLREHGVQRKIGLSVSNYSQALHIAARTDLVAFVPNRLIEVLAGPLGLVTVTPPIDPGWYEEFLFHPSRLEADPASQWLRGQVKQVGRGLDRGSGRARPGGVWTGT